MTYRLIIDTTTQRGTSEIEINTRICNMPICHVAMPFKNFFGTLDPEMGPVAKSILKKINKIVGIEKIYLKHYGMTVHYAEAFSWINIEEAIIAVMKEQFGNDLIVISDSERSNANILPFAKR